MGSQPSIHTANMEGVAAFGQQPKHFFFLKFTQTNRALCSFDQTFAFLVLANRDRIDDRLLQPDRGDEPNWMIDLILVQKLSLSAVRLRRLLPPVPGATAAGPAFNDHDIETESEENPDKQSNQDDG